MKNFKEYISENLEGFQGAGLSSHKVPHDLEDGDVKRTINAILGHTAVSEFLNPKAAIAQIEAKLALLGLNREEVVSDDPRVDGIDGDELQESGELEIPFSRYGNIIGKTVDTPIDEIESESVIYNLKLKYEQLESGSYKVYGSLV
jgi:hypothetical protein